jgi:hypothetical protein
MACADALGWTASDVDRCSFYEVYSMLRGAGKREEREWQRTLYLVQAVVNYGGPRGKNFKPKPLDHLYNQMFGHRRERKVMTHDQIRAVFAASSVTRDA